MQNSSAARARKQALAKREAAVKKREDALEEREAALKKREDALGEKQEQICGGSDGCDRKDVKTPDSDPATYCGSCYCCECYGRMATHKLGVLSKEDKHFCGKCMQ